MSHFDNCMSLMSLQPLIPIAFCEEGLEWLNENYHHLLSPFMAFDEGLKEVDYTPDEKTRLRRTYGEFKKIFLSIQKKHSDALFLELMESEEREERAKKEKKKRRKTKKGVFSVKDDDFEEEILPAKCLVRVPSSPVVSKNTESYKTAWRPGEVDGYINSESSAGDEHFEKVISRKDRRRNRHFVPSPNECEPCAKSGSQIWPGERRSKLHTRSQTNSKPTPPRFAAAAKSVLQRKHESPENSSGSQSRKDVRSMPPPMLANSVICGSPEKRGQGGGNSSAKFRSWWEEARLRNSSHGSSKKGRLSKTEGSLDQGEKKVKSVLLGSLHGMSSLKVDGLLVESDGLVQEWQQKCVHTSCDSGSCCGKDEESVCDISEGSASQEFLLDPDLDLDDAPDLDDNDLSFTLEDAPPTPKDESEEEWYGDNEGSLGSESWHSSRVSSPVRAAKYRVMHASTGSVAQAKDACLREEELAFDMKKMTEEVDRLIHDEGLAAQGEGEIKATEPVETFLPGCCDDVTKLLMAQQHLMNSGFVLPCLTTWWPARTSGKCRQLL